MGVKKGKKRGGEVLSEWEAERKRVSSAEVLKGRRLRVKFMGVTHSHFGK